MKVGLSVVGAVIGKVCGVDTGVTCRVRTPAYFLFSTEAPPAYQKLFIRLSSC